MPAEGHWHSLSVLLGTASSVARSHMRRPAPPGLPRVAMLHQLGRAAAETGTEELFAKHLLSGALLSGSRQSHHRLVRELASSFLPDADSETLTRCSWIGVPILVVQGGRSHEIWLLAGRLPGTGMCHFPGAPLPNRETRTSIRNALCYKSREHDYWCWFLQCADEQPVSGDSLGLPVALAACLLERSRPWPDGVYATGAVEPDGTVRAVDHVRQKLQAVRIGCRLFLRPCRKSITGHGDGVEQECSTITDALFALDLFTGGISGSDIIVYRACGHDPHFLLSRFHDLPLSVLDTDPCRKTLEQAAADPGRFLGELVRALRQCGYDRSRGRRLVDLFAVRKIQEIVRQATGLAAHAAFDWCMACIAFFNHQGDTGASADWIEVAQGLRSLIDEGELARLVNHAFVSSRFNRYDFRPDPPPEFMNFLEMEKAHATTGRSSVLFGAMLGTMAQNYGFCGPSFLDLLLEKADQAEKAFGRRYENEARRLQNYTIYGLLDSGRLEEACALLPAYLGLAPASAAGEWFREVERLLADPREDAPFRAALALRLLADTGFRPDPGNVARSMPGVMQNVSHPWQLIALNLGKILARCDRAEEAAELFRHGLRICGDSGDTMRPMQLLFLAELHGLGRAGNQEYTRARDLLAWLSSTPCLERNHFAMLFTITDPADLLGVVREQAATLFPFSYR